MASKILLISSNRCVIPDPVFPLGLAHVNFALRKAGHATHWFDCQLESPSLEEVIHACRPDFAGLSLRNIDDVLVRKQETFFNEIGSLCQRIRAQVDCPIILGGSGFSIFPRELLEFSGAEYGIRGEGGVSLVSLIQALEQKRDPTRVPGLVYRRGAQIIINPQTSNSLPEGAEAPDRPAHLVKHYLRTSGMLNLQTQRGCPFHCCYCTYPLLEGDCVQCRPAKDVADELELLASLGARYAFIVDSVFNSSPAHVTAVCEAILRRKPKIQWGCFLRPQGLTPELMKLMVRSGLSHIEFGTDSFCDEVLNAYGKGFTFTDVLAASELARREQVHFCHFLICGGPGETLETLRSGFENSKKIEGGIFLAVAGMRIYPGTALAKRAAKEGQINPQRGLLTPAYYFAPGLNAEKILSELHAFARLAPNWIAGDPSPEYNRLVQRLRERQVVGPLWSYFSMIQRLWPQPVISQLS